MNGCDVSVDADEILDQLFDSEHSKNYFAMEKPTAPRDNWVHSVGAATTWSDEEICPIKNARSNSVLWPQDVVQAEA